MWTETRLICATYFFSMYFHIQYIVCMEISDTPASVFPGILVLIHSSYICIRLSIYLSHPAVVSVYFWTDTCIPISVYPCIHWSLYLSFCLYINPRVSHQPVVQEIFNIFSGSFAVILFSICVPFSTFFHQFFLWGKLDVLADHGRTEIRSFPVWQEVPPRSSWFDARDSTPSPFLFSLHPF